MSKEKSIPAGEVMSETFEAIPTLEELLERNACEVIEVIISRGQTISDGNYGNAKYFASFKARVAEDEDPSVIWLALHARVYGEVERQKAYDERIKQIHDWLDRWSIELDELRAKREEIESDATLLPVNKGHFLVRLDELISARQEQDAEEARQRAEDHLTFQLIIEHAGTFQAPDGEPTTDDLWRQDLKRAGFLDKLHTRRMRSWRYVTRAQWAAANPEDLLNGIVPEVTPAPAEEPESAEESPPTTPSEPTLIVEGLSRYFLVNPNTDETEDMAWLTPSQVAEFNEGRRAEGDDCRWISAKEVNAEEAPSGDGYDDFDADSYRVEFDEPLDFDSFSNEPVTDEYEG